MRFAIMLVLLVFALPVQAQNREIVLDEAARAEMRMLAERIERFLESGQEPPRRYCLNPGEKIEDCKIILLKVVEAPDLRDLMMELNAVFGQILKMNRDQAIVAWQTLDFMGVKFPAGSEGRGVVEKFQKAIIIRMAELVRTSRQPGEISSVFGSVTGRSFYH